MQPDIKPTHTIQYGINANINIVKSTPLLSYISYHLKVSATNVKTDKIIPKLNANAEMLKFFFFYFDLCGCAMTRCSRVYLKLCADFNFNHTQHVAGVIIYYCTCYQVFFFLCAEIQFIIIFIMIIIND